MIYLQIEKFRILKSSEKKLFSAEKFLPAPLGQ